MARKAAEVYLSARYGDYRQDMVADVYSSARYGGRNAPVTPRGKSSVVPITSGSNVLRHHPESQPPVENESLKNCIEPFHLYKTLVYFYLRSDGKSVSGPGGRRTSGSNALRHHPECQPPVESEFFNHPLKVINTLVDLYENLILFVSNPLCVH